MEKQRKKYKNLLEDNLTNQETFKSLITLPLIPLDIVEYVYNYQRNKNHNNQEFELKELSEYYEKELFILKYPPEMWNYFNTDKNRTNYV